MKHLILVGILNKLKTDRSLRKKLKIFLVAVFVGCLMVGSLVVWGGITVLRGIANVGTSPVVQEKIMRLETEIQNAPALVKVGCWETVRNLMNVESWLEKPIAENFTNIKSACLIE